MKWPWVHSLFLPMLKFSKNLDVSHVAQYGEVFVFVFAFVANEYLDVGHVAQHREDDEASNEAGERVDWAENRCFLQSVLIEM